jgi:predicted nucleic-acid-binding protein
MASERRYVSAMRAIDTNVLVRILTRDDVRQAGVADAFIERGAWVSILALAEATWVLSAVYDRTPKEIATAIEMLLHHEALSLQDPDMVSAALKTFRKRQTLGYSDCLLLEIARKAGHLPLGTFDRGLAKLEDTQALS